MKPHILTLLLVVLFYGCNAQIMDDYEKKFQARADKILTYAADMYELPAPNYSDPEKVYWPATIARLSKYGPLDKTGNKLLNHPKFREKLPFHFILAGMARLMPLFPEAPSMKENKLLYLSNVAARKDSYNAWTCEGTENHINMSRTSGYIFAEQMLEYPDIFPQAESWRIMMKDWLIYYVPRVITTGSGEFNASTYGVFNIIGFLNLYDFARDPEVKQLAKDMLDYYASELALHHFQGMTSGAESRGAPSAHALAHETEWLSWLWFGGITEAREKAMFKECRNKAPLQPVHAATSSYRPDPSIIALAEKKWHSNNWYVNSKPSYLLHTPGYIRHFLYQTPSYSLGSAIYPYGAFATSAYKNTTWKLISRVEEQKENPQLITGGGGYYSDRRGMIRNPYTQVAQYKNVLIMMNLLPSDHEAIHENIEEIFVNWKRKWYEDFVKRFSEEDDKVTAIGNPVKLMDRNPDSDHLNSCYIWNPDNIKDTIINNVLFIELDKSYIAVTSVSLDQPLKESEEIFTDSAPPGSLCGLVLEVSAREGFADLEAFVSAFNPEKERLFFDEENLSLNYLSQENFDLRVKYKVEGSFTEPIYDWGFGPILQSHLQMSPPFIQPIWPEGPGYGRIPEIWLDGKRIYNEPDPPVYQGPGIRIERGEILLEW